MLKHKSVTAHMKAFDLNGTGDGTALAPHPTIQPERLVFIGKFVKVPICQKDRNESASKLLDVRMKRQSMREFDTHQTAAGAGRGEAHQR